MRITSRITRISAASAVLAALMLTQQACANGTPTAAPPAAPPAPQSSSGAPASDAPDPSSASGKKPDAKPAATKPTTTKKAAAGGVFSGTRETRLLPINTEGTFGVTSSRKVELSDAFDDKTLFVLTKVQGERYGIRTARIRAGAEALCLQVESNSRVTAALCDAGKSTQLFLFRNTGTSQGKLKYTIRTNKDIYLIVTPEGGVRAVPIGEGTPDIDTPFFLPDLGKANMPVLD